MKKVKGIVISILIALFGISTMPFSVYADSFTVDNIIGFNVVQTQLDQYDANNRSNTVEVIFDDNYMGSFRLRFDYTTGNNQTLTWDYYVYVNGNSVFINVFTVSNTLVNTNIKNVRVSSANMYKASEFDFPIESMSAVMSLGLAGHPITSIDNVGRYTYPTFSIPVYDSSNPSASQICRFTINPDNPNANSYVLIFGINRNVYNQTTLNNALYWVKTSGPSIEFEWAETLYRNNYAPYSVVKCRIYFTNLELSTTTANVTVYALNACKLTPIYFNYEAPDNIGMDFALQYNLENKITKALEEIAGNTESEESASDLEDTMSDFTQASDNVINVENDIGSGFENSLDDIPNTFNFQSQFGASFISSAQWVRDQFNNMTINNPFGSLITFSLILGVGLLLLGRKLL